MGKGPFSQAELKPFDLSPILHYLQKKNYTERISIIELLASIPESKNRMAVSENGIRGFILSRPGRIKPFIGPLIADSDEIALDLLQQVLNYWKDLGFENVFLDIPEAHIDLRSIFTSQENVHADLKIRQIPIKPVRSFSRMYQVVEPEDLNKYNQNLQKAVAKKAAEGYEKTTVFMEKERKEIVPIMYASAGPEWS